MLTSLTSSISRCERCIHNRVYIVLIVDIAIHEMNRNFGLFCLFAVGRDVLVTLQYTHIISRQLLSAADNVKDIYCDELKPISCRIFADSII